MRIGQSAISVHLLINLGLQVVLLSLICLVAMSDDDFICAGVPVGESSSDSPLVGGTSGASAGPAIAHLVAPESRGEESGSSVGSDDCIVGGGGSAAHPVEPVRRRRNRARKQAQTSGSLWTLATVGTLGAPTGVGPQDAFAMLRLSWSLTHPNYEARNSFDVGRLEHRIERSLFFQSPVTLPEDLGDGGKVGDGFSAASVLRAMSLCEESLLVMEDGTTQVCGAFMATQDAHCKSLLAFSHTEATRVRSPSAEAPFRSSPVYSRSRYPPTIGQVGDAGTSKIDFRYHFFCLFSVFILVFFFEFS